MGIIVLGGDPLEEEESEETDIDDVSNDDGDFAFFVSAAVFTIIIMSIVGIGAALAVRKYWRRRTVHSRFPRGLSPDVAGACRV